MRNLRTGSSPCVVHSPGMGSKDYASTNPCWDDFVSISRSARSGRPLETTVVICSNLGDSPLEACLRGVGVGYVKLGSDRPKWNNLLKVSLLEEYLKVHPGGPILYMDSRDVVIVGDLSAVDGALERHSCEMLFSAETQFYPRCPSLKGVEEAERKASPNEYFALNAGCWLADPGFLREAIADFWAVDVGRHVQENRGHLKEYSVAKDDQFRWHLLYDRHRPRIRLDHGCELFQTAFMHKHEDFEM